MIKLTTVVANYNYAHFLEEAVLSILKQDGPNEVLIVDDGSTDGSRDLITQLSQTYSNVRYHFKKKNEGVEEACNTGLKLARGEYVHLFASDDIYLPHSLRIILDYISHFPGVPCFCSDFAYFSNHLNIRVKRQLLECNKPTFYSPEKVFKLFQTTNFWIPGHTLVSKRTVYTKYTPQDKQLGSISDWLINHTMALKEGIGYIPQGLIAMRQHSQNLSSSFSAEKKRSMWLYLLDILEKNPDKYMDLYKSGILRMIGIKTIYRDLLQTPRYWKYLLSMIKREYMKR